MKINSYSESFTVPQVMTRLDAIVIQKPRGQKISALKKVEKSRGKLKILALLY